MPAVAAPSAAIPPAIADAITTVLPGAPGTTTGAKVLEVVLEWCGGFVVDVGL